MLHAGRADHEHVHELAVVRDQGTPVPAEPRRVRDPDREHGPVRVVGHRGVHGKRPEDAAAHVAVDRVPPGVPEPGRRHQQDRGARHRDPAPAAMRPPDGLLGPQPALADCRARDGHRPGDEERREQ